LKDKNDREGVVLGRYSYDAENGPSLQRFKPQVGFSKISFDFSYFLFSFL